MPRNQIEEGFAERSGEGVHHLVEATHLELPEALRSGHESFGIVSVEETLQCLRRPHEPCQGHP